MIEQAKLATWEIEGEDLADVASALRGVPGVDVVPFGNTLHVSGKDRAALEGALAPLASRAGVAVREAEPGLEDVFIHLMRDVGESAKPAARKGP